MVCPPLTSFKTLRIFSFVIPSRLNSVLIPPIACCVIPKIMCSVLIYSSPRDLASCPAVLNPDSSHDLNKAVLYYPQPLEDIRVLFLLGLGLFAGLHQFSLRFQ